MTRAPLVVFAAGLPDTLEKMMTAAGFAERCDFYALDEE